MTLFKSVADALKFTYQFCNHQYAKSPVMNSGGGGGTEELSGNDGAAQAGFMSQELRQLSQVKQVALKARFSQRWCECKQCGSEQASDEWIGVCKALSEYYQSILAPDAHIKMLTLLVQRHFLPKERKMSLSEIAEKFGDGHSKVKHINAKLHPALKKLERAAQTQVDQIFTERGWLQSYEKEPLVA